MNSLTIWFIVATLGITLCQGSPQDKAMYEIMKEAREGFRGAAKNSADAVGNGANAVLKAIRTVDQLTSDTTKKLIDGTFSIVDKIRDRKLNRINATAQLGQRLLTSLVSSKSIPTDEIENQNAAAANTHKEDVVKTTPNPPVQLTTQPSKQSVTPLSTPMQSISDNIDVSQLSSCHIGKCPGQDNRICVVIKHKKKGEFIPMPTRPFIQSVLQLFPKIEIDSSGNIDESTLHPAHLGMCPNEHRVCVIYLEQIIGSF